MTTDVPDVKSDPPARDTSALTEVALGLINTGQAAGVPLRLCGGLACWVRAGEAGRRFALAAGRTYSDFDLAANFADRSTVVELLKRAGFKESSTTATVPGSRRGIFSGPGELHGDVFYDVIDFCHCIDFRHRLEVDYPTLPVAELLLHKLQIMELTAKDIIDAQVLLFEFEFTASDKDAISVPRVAGLCGSDWGLFRTTCINIDRISTATQSAAYFQADQRNRVLGQLARLRELLDEAPKSLRWRFRAILGEHVRWYETVEEDEVEP